MNIDLFGFNITKASKQPIKKVVPEIEAENNDGAIEIASSGSTHAIQTNFNAYYSTKVELINLYRTMATDPAITDALEDIVNETIIIDGSDDVINLSLDKAEDLGKDTKEKIIQAFDKVLRLLNFNNDCQDIFKKWYVDGRLNAYVILPKANDNNDISKTSKTGIEEVRFLDPRNVDFIREKDENTKEIKEYFTYQNKKHKEQEREAEFGVSTYGTKDEPLIITNDAMIFVPSGEYDLEGNVVSFMHPAIKPYNQLTTLEDYTVIYRMVRSTERRVFYIDVGELPKTKAEQYMRSIIAQHQNKMKYDSKTGQMTESSNMRSMLEDIWLPRRDGQRATEVDTLQGGVNVGEMEDVQYFRKKLYLALHIPQSRLDVDSRFTLGKSSEITRDELKFTRYVEKVRRKFNKLLIELLRIEVILNNTLTTEEWDDIKNDIRVEYNEDSHFAELKRAELMSMRLESLSAIEEFVGKYFSVEMVQKDILRRTEEEVDVINKQIEKEIKAGILKRPDDADEDNF